MLLFCQRISVGDLEDSFARKYHYKAFFPLSPREFVALTTWTETGDGRQCLIATSSLPDEYFPTEGVYLRAHVLMSSFLLQSVSDDETEVTMINHSHVGATVPMYLVNKAAVSIPTNYVRSLRRVLEK